MSLPLSHLAFDGDEIWFAYSHQPVWRIAFADIQVIGEYTNEDGPADDYFFVFVLRDAWYEASFYAPGRESFRAELAGRLGVDIQPSLLNSTSFASRVLWPERLAGHELFTFSPEAKSTAWLSRVRQLLSPRIDMRLTDAVLREIERPGDS